MALRNLLLMTKEMRFLLQKQRKGLLLRTQPKSNLTPMGGWFGDMFTIQTIMKYYEVIPVIVAGVITAILPVIHCGFLIYKTNDIIYRRGERMLIEKHQYIIDGAPPPCHRYIVMNQKYEWPCGLLKALKGNNDCCEQKKMKKVSFKFWKKGEPLKDIDDEPKTNSKND